MWKFDALLITPDGIQCPLWKPEHPSREVNIHISFPKPSAIISLDPPIHPSIPLRLDGLLRLLRRRLQLSLELLTLALDLSLRRLQALVVHVDPANLGSTNNKH